MGAGSFPGARGFVGRKIPEPCLVGLGGRTAGRVFRGSPLATKSRGRGGCGDSGDLGGEGQPRRRVTGPLPVAEEFAEADGGSSVPPSPYTTPSYLTVPLPAEPSPGAPAPLCRPGHGGRRRCELALLGCATLLGAVGLGADVAEARAADGEEQRRWLDGLFPRAGRFPRGLSPPGRSPGRRDDAAPGLGLAPSATLVSLSSVSDCNSTRSLLRSDSDEAAPAAPSPPPSPPGTNPLVDLELESFKKDPRQSLTPTHVTAARAVSRGHRRTPSDGALGQRGAPEPAAPRPGE